MHRESVLTKAEGLRKVKVCSRLRRSPVGQPQNLLRGRLKVTKFVSQRHAKYLRGLCRIHPAGGFCGRALSNAPLSSVRSF